MSSILSAAVSNTVSFEKLSFWTLGYGGWMGVSMLPILWSLPLSGTLKLMLSVLTPAISALTITAIFSAFYFIGVFTYTMSSIMIHPAFLESCISIVCISLASVAFFLINGRRIAIQMYLKREKEGDEDVGSEEGDDENENENENVGSEEGDDENEEDVGSEEGDDENEEDVGSDGTVSDASSTTAESTSAWREDANFEALRNAPPLSE